MPEAQARSSTSAWALAKELGPRGITVNTVRDYTSVHPAPEHFWPVLVATGIAGDDVGRRVHEGCQHGRSMSAFMFRGFEREPP